MSFLHFKITSLKNREEEPGVSGDKCSHCTQSDGSPANVSPVPELNHMVFGVVILSRIWGERDHLGLIRWHQGNRKAPPSATGNLKRRPE